jgi:SpoIID/LytB domain protein
MTRSLHDVGLSSGNDDGNAYPYYAVPCPWCHDHPLGWQRQLSADQKPPRPGDERQRVESARQWGWSALPGNDFTAARNESGWKIEGHNVGHGVGMCQRGAIGMAESGSDFRAILSHYYPNTSFMILN